MPNSSSSPSGTNLALVAIDPGASGGLAFVFPGKPSFALPMPKSEIETFELISGVVEKARIENFGLEVLMEKVGGFVGKGQPGSAMFRFGRSVGVLAGILIALRIPFREIQPQAWLRNAGAGTAGNRTKGEWKRHLRNLAAQRHPHLKPTLSTADALLMLDSFR